MQNSQRVNFSKDTYILKGTKLRFVFPGGFRVDNRLHSELDAKLSGAGKPPEESDFVYIASEDVYEARKDLSIWKYLDLVTRANAAVYIVSEVLGGDEVSGYPEIKFPENIEAVNVLYIPRNAEVANEHRNVFPRLTGRTNAGKVINISRLPNGLNLLQIISNNAFELEYIADDFEFIETILESAGYKIENRNENVIWVFANLPEYRIEV